MFGNFSVIPSPYHAGIAQIFEEPQPNSTKREAFSNEIFKCSATMIFTASQVEIIDESTMGSCIICFTLEQCLLLIRILAIDSAATMQFVWLACYLVLLIGHVLAVRSSKEMSYLQDLHAEAQRKTKAEEKAKQKAQGRFHLRPSLEKDPGNHVFSIHSTRAPGKRAIFKRSSIGFSTQPSSRKSLLWFPSTFLWLYGLKRRRLRRKHCSRLKQCFLLPC